MPLPFPAGLTLFAQEAVSVSLGSAKPSPIATLLAVFIPITIISVPAILLGLRYARRERELEHAERMRALEMGLSLPRDAPFWTPNNTCIALGVVMPLALFVKALVASKADPLLVPYVWPVAAVLGGLGIVGGTLLALIRPRAATAPGPAAGGLAAKRHLDPDTYDTAGRRGWDAATARDSSHA